MEEGSLLSCIDLNFALVNQFGIEKIQMVFTGLKPLIGMIAMSLLTVMFNAVSSLGSK